MDVQTGRIDHLDRLQAEVRNPATVIELTDEEKARLESLPPVERATALLDIRLERLKDLATAVEAAHEAHE